jgi:hypothetical protein
VLRPAAGARGRAQTLVGGRQGAYAYHAPALLLRALIANHVAAMTDTALRVFRAGHLPVMGEWFALPLIEHAGSAGLGDPVFDEIFHPIARRLVAKCDACLRIGGPSAGADEIVALAKQHGKAVYYALDEIPGTR